MCVLEVTHTCCRNHLCSTRSQTHSHCKRHKGTNTWSTKIEQKISSKLGRSVKTDRADYCKAVLIQTDRLLRKAQSPLAGSAKGLWGLVQKPRKTKKEKGWRGLKSSQNETEIHSRGIGAEILTCRQLTAAAWIPLWVCRALAHLPCLCLKNKTTTHAAY